jgi:pyrroloquinoline quinone (PQQ) biosynthesis protein C
MEMNSCLHVPTGHTPYWITASPSRALSSIDEALLPVALRSPASTGARLLDALESRNARLVQQHPFVRRCATGRVSLPALKVFLAQQGKYGAFFTRYLCAVIANLPDTGDVARLTQNLAEELGYGDSQGEPHAAIYARMLKDFGIDRACAPTLPATQKLIDTMLAYCKRDNPAYGLAALCLAAEAIVPPLYRDLMSGFLACGVPESQLEFFRLHIECDDGHGQAMREILVRMLGEDLSLSGAVHEAATQAIHARLSFFSAIERETA